MATVTYASPPEWVPLETRKDYCQHGICSHYCPQNCAFFSPPPPFDFIGEGMDDSSDSNTTLSPLVIAIIGILASAFLLVGYYAVVSRCFKNRRRRGRRDNEDPLRGDGADTGQSRQDAWQSTPPLSEGLDESVIKSITVCRYKKGDGFVEGTDCPVCLGEFSEDEQVRLLPRCCHAFHVHCIDTWLKSHSSCPICRVNVPPVSVQVLLEMGRPATASVEEVREGTPDGFEVRRSHWSSTRTLECVLVEVSGSKQQGTTEQGNCSSSM